MLINVTNYQNEQNYRNIIITDYLNNIGNISISRGKGGIEFKKIRTINHYQYFYSFFKYLKDFMKDRNFLIYEMKDLITIFYL